MGASIRSLQVTRELRRLGPCMEAWGPDTCARYSRRQNGPHMCWTWRGWPHLCRCMRCGETRLNRVV